MSEDPNDKIWYTDRKIWHRIFFQMNVKLSSSLRMLIQKQKRRCQKLRVMQNIHSPNRLAVVIVIKHSLTVDNQEKVSHNLEETILHSLVKVCINC